ncbi:hypothetical protein J2X01_000305 [Arthrobacter ginsengisoli]|uniref:Uncharacterized protein n=1 Tax=Arthrobacter ginsengisoli TaxID=1356565 RepID=A0ABU1U777_9MICC|nr:hypothetical protein [Arthrobacter ginsengisoli]
MTDQGAPKISGESGDWPGVGVCIIRVQPFREHTVVTVTIQSRLDRHLRSDAVPRVQTCLRIEDALQTVDEFLRQYPWGHSDQGERPATTPDAGPGNASVTLQHLVSYTWEHLGRGGRK